MPPRLNPTAATTPALHDSALLHLHRALLSGGPGDDLAAWQAVVGRFNALAASDDYLQWLTEAESRALAPERLEAVGAEIADVLLYLIQLADALGIDPVAAAEAKLKVNALKYPVERSRGNSRKADDA